MKSTVSHDGRLTIPKPLRDRLGIHAGDVLDLREDAGRLVATKTNAGDHAARVFGILRPGRPTDRLIEELRGKVDPAAR